MGNNTAETMVMVKAEPAAPDVITVDVDPEALNCPKCTHPLKHPVFQVPTYVLQVYKLHEFNSYI
jgi:hypothetical protein